ncbi:nitroreductase family protein [Facklamia miroungae]|uniref:hypothetical protein n=1 Tax=Facklamia miroungae TaxID=120956 RepID=UPI001FE007F1|nr:hypothetical protein [Facklamia miroungae]
MRVPLLMDYSPILVIRITTPTIREELVKVADQAYLAKVPKLLIFLVDGYQNAEIARSKGYRGENDGSMGYFFKE